MRYPNLNEEKKLWKRGYKIVIGLDEAGRGPLAGPVIASAVVITTAKIKNQKSKTKNIVQDLKLLENIRDSKKLSQKKREEFYEILTNHPRIKWGLGRVSEKVIDKINILEAAKLAMGKAIENMKRKMKSAEQKIISKKPKQKPDYLIIDGNFILSAKVLAKTGIDLPILQKSIVKADEKVFSCAAASIIAKVSRDRIMRRYDEKYSKYGFGKHKGYGTKLHFETLKKYGPCEIHRKSFRPVKFF